MEFESTVAMYRWVAEEIASASRAAEAVHTRILIVSTPRSGSTFFCDALERTGLVGRPVEFFNKRLLAALSKVKPRPVFVGGLFCRLIGYFSGAPLVGSRIDSQELWLGERAWVDIARYNQHLEHCFSVAGIFCVHVHVEHWRSMERWGNGPTSMGFDKVLHVGRRDRLRQALSLAIAEKYDHWDSRVLDSRPSDVTVTRQEVLHALNKLDNWQAYYEAEISRYVTAEFYSEDFLAAPDLIGDVPMMLGLAPARVEIPPSDLRASTAHSAETQYRDICDWLGVTPSA